jgi:molecular chaperone HtpG
MAKHQFQTEVGQLLHLMTHSLYSNKEIFIRELISNASDALDKLEYLKLTQLKDFESKPNIFVVLDKEDNSITIGDNGIGMDEADLVENLGTIAKSGTKAFLEKLSGDAKKDSNLIGQFGVGFYSVFMVAQRVDVITKKASSNEAYMWSSDGSGEYEIKPVTKDENGTIVYIKLKEDESEFCEKYRVEHIIKKYSNHIAYPINLKWSEEEEVGEDDKKETKKVEKNEQVNSAKALWTIAKKDLKEDDYKEFYKTISHGDEEPLSWVHVKAEGINNYTLLLYIPSKAPFDMYRVDYQPGVKLYVKRVFITDDDKELLPSYLRFIRGVIDSEDLPLNVSREILQENKIMANIKQGAVKKIIAEIKKILKDDKKAQTFINEFNKPIKEGIYQDYVNKESLLEIVRYKTTKTKIGQYTSLAEYKDRANSEQKAIYYIIGDDEKVLRNSPLLEAYKKNDIEVLICDDKEIDEIITPAIGAYKEWEFKDITTCEPPKVEVDEKTQEETQTKYKDIIEKIKNILKDEVKDVKITHRLNESPSCVVKDSSDPMANMSAMFKAMGQEMPDIPLILEINPEHEIVKKLNTHPDDKMIEDISWVLLDSAKLSEGLEVKDPVAFSKRLNSIMQKALS